MQNLRNIGSVVSKIICLTSIHNFFFLKQIKTDSYTRRAGVCYFIKFNQHILSKFLVWRHHRVDGDGYTKFDYRFTIYIICITYVQNLTNIGPVVSKIICLTKIYELYFFSKHSEVWGKNWRRIHKLHVRGILFHKV